MATLAERAVAAVVGSGEETATAATVNTSEQSSETCVVLAAVENEDEISKDCRSADSGILLCKSDSGVFEAREEMTDSAKDDDGDQQRCSQESKTSISLTQSSSDNKSSSSSSTLKGSQDVNDEDDDSRSSTSTIKNSQQAAGSDSDHKSRSRSSSRSSSAKTSPSKQSSQGTVKESQNTQTDPEEDNDSRSSFASSNSKSTVKRSQPATDRSDDENSRSSFQSSSRKSSPEKHSQSTTRGSQSTRNDLTEDSDSRSSFTSSNSKSTTKNSQPIVDKSDDESDSPIQKSQTSSEKSSKTKKYLSIIDSDSEDEIAVPSKSTNNEDSDSDSAAAKGTQSDKKSKVKSKMKLLDSDSEEDDKKNDEDDKSINKSNKFSNIIDSESESDRDNRSDRGNNASSGEEENDAGQSKKGKKKLQKKRVGSVRAAKDAAMQEIHSETQRLLRESEISLPYHKPKQRTLQEFLNRKKVSASIPQNLTCAEKVKLLNDVISKVVQEKEKEAEEFYKSSDSEEEQEKIDKPEEAGAKVNDETENKNESTSIDLDPVNISDTQKLTQDHIQDLHNKRSFLQQRSSDFGVPRKLFLDDDSNPDKAETVPNEEGNPESENIDAVKKHKEFKTGLQEFSVPHKLFTGEVEAMELCDEAGAPVLARENLEIAETTENTRKNEEASENTDKHESSTEDFVLQMPETESNAADGKDVAKSEETVDKKEKVEKQGDDEPIANGDRETMIAETPIISSKEFAALNKSIASTNQETSDKSEEAQKPNDPESMEETEDDIVLELPKETNEDDEVIDKNVLKDDYFKPPDFDEIESKEKSLKEKILASALKSKPKIKALPGSLIEFTSTEQMNEGVTKLMDRFVRHSAVHKHTATPVSEVKVMRTEGSGEDIELIEEVLPFNKTLMEDDYTKENKPGEKLKILKQDLKRKIASVKNEEWKQKEETEQDGEEEEEGKGGKGDDFYEGLPDEEDELEDEESAESEPEEDDVPMVDKKRPKCEFGDEEAEESLEEGGEESEGDDEEDEESLDEADSSGEEEEEAESNKGPRKLKRIIKPFDEEDDSNDSAASLKNKDTEAETKLSLERTKTDKDMFASQIKSNFVLEDMEAESIPAFDRDRLDADARSQACKTPLPRCNMVLSMISPVTHLTVLNAYNDSAKKSDAKTPNLDLGRISTEHTPLENSNDRPPNSCNMEKMMSLQKKLFEDPPETVQDSELLEICSGKFGDSQDSEQQQQPAVAQHEKQNEVTDSQLMDICSGSFITQTIDLKQLGNESSLPFTADETSQDITLILDHEDEPPKRSPITKSSSSMKRSDESMFSSDSMKTFSSASPVKFKSPPKSVFKSKNPMDAWLKKANANPAPTQAEQRPQNEVTDSQLLEICSGGFESQPVDIKALESEASQIQKSRVPQDVHQSENQTKETEELQKEKTVEEGEDEESKAPWTGFVIASSSDEENKPDASQNKKKKRTKKKVLKKKKVQKLELSDEEDEERNEFSEESEYEEMEGEDEEKYVDYDSDENEVVVVPKKEIRKVAGKFLENEAELSESEWGSDDEDEQDLDKLEYEEGDAEDIDEAEMKDQLDRIHMKQVMDEDQREVRMLQELLFDDGDLHSEGAGRERKFRWKNVDNLGEDENVGPSLDDNVDGFDDDIDVSMEVQMRKMRYEQQKFLEEKEKKMVESIHDDFADSQLLKSSLKVVSVRSGKQTSTTMEQTITKSVSDTNKNVMMNVVSKKSITSTKSFSFSNMRGSFLARGQDALTRIAQQLPETTKMPSNPNRKKTFVFAHLSPIVAKPQEDSEQENDTPAKDSKKRKRKIFPSQQTPTTIKKAKIDDKKPGKKLF